jgi:innexin
MLFLDCQFEGYYQWVTILLLLMALCFYIPRLFWRSFNTHCGIDIQSLIGNSQQSESAATKMLEYYCQSLKSTTVNPSMRLQINYRRNKHRGNYLFTVYLISRVMYLINSIVQLFLLNALLGHRGHAWMLDIDIMRSIFRYGNPLLDSPYFPRVALCDIFIREISDIHRYTVQCALPINILNEKIFLGLSFWISYVVLHNLCSFVVLIYQQLASQRVAYVHRLTKMVHINGNQGMERFCLNYLTFDGLFLLRLISHNSSELRTVEVLRTMFTNYQKRMSS